MNVRYQTVVENFDPPDLQSQERISIASEVEPLSGDLEFASVSFSTGIAGQEIHDVSLRVQSGESIAVIGGEGSGRPELMSIASGLIAPSSGKVRIGDQNLDAASEAVLGREIAYIGPSPHIFTGTVRDNLVYGLRHRPRVVLPDAEVDDDERRRRAEAERTGNIDFTVENAWEDLSVLNVETDAEMDAVVVDLADAVGLGDDIYRMGLYAYVGEEEEPEIVAGILKMRESFAERARSEPHVQELVDLWDFDQFNASAPLAENLLFAVPRDHAVELQQIADDADIIEFLKDAGMHAELIDIGIAIAEIMVELFAGVSDSSDLLGSDALITADDLPAYDTLLKHIKAVGKGKLKRDEEKKFIGLAFRLIPARHRLGIMDDEKAARVVAARKVFHERADRFAGRYMLFARDRFVESLTIEENIIFGKPRLDRRGSREEIERLIGETADTLGLRRPIALAGLDFHVGVSGSRLSSGQRRRLSLARALLKRPKVIAFEDVDDTLGDNIRLLSGIRQHLSESTIIAGSSRFDRISDFERILMLRNGRVVAEGNADKIRAAMQKHGAAEEEM